MTSDMNEDTSTGLSPELHRQLMSAIAGRTYEESCGHYEYMFKTEWGFVRCLNFPLFMEKTEVLAFLGDIVFMFTKDWPLSQRVFTEDSPQVTLQECTYNGSSHWRLAVEYVQVK